MAANGNNGGSSETFNLSLKLRQRLRETNIQKERTQAQINVQTEQLQRLFSLKPKKPRDSLERMDAKLIDLEYQRTRASLPLSKEKLILRQIDTIKRDKIKLDEFNSHEQTIQEKKADISNLRDSLRTIIAAIAELDSALAKVELADRLGCTTAELQIRVVDCPEGKLGFVIGKNGGTIKQLEEQTGVQVDIDKVGSKIHLHGSESALDAAVREIEKITLAITEDIKIPSEVTTYLLTRRLGSFAKLQKDHIDVYFDLSKESSMISLRGKPEDVSAARYDIDNLGVKLITKDLTQKEAGFVVGKGGGTITKLVEDYEVIIEVSNDKNAETATVEVIGLGSNADAAMKSIEDILFQNEEVEEFVMVRPMQRNKFLNNSAAVVRELQAEISSVITGGGILLFFEKRLQAKDDFGEASKLFVRTSRANAEKAKQMVQSRVETFEANTIKMTVSTHCVPAILGKGGETINSLRKEGTGADIDMDKVSGIIQIHADDEETRNAVKTAIEKIVSENQVKKVEIEKSMIGLVLGELGKDMRKEVSDLGATLSVDPSDRYLVVKGTDDQIEEGAGIVQTFIECNYTEEFEIHSDDHGILLQGGSDSVLRKAETDNDVKVNIRKTSNMLIVRGRKDNVEAALVEIKRFLYGGDGFAVYKLKVPEGLLGVVIGKGGSNISKLESDHDGLTIQANGETSVLCIRGPQDKVNECRSQVICQLASSKITENVLVTSDQHYTLSQQDTLKKLMYTTGASLALTETFVKIRGTTADVRDAKAMLQEHLTGRYEQTIELDPSQLNRVRAASKDPSHFKRIQDATGTEVSLDTASSAILISGKRSSVKKAKTFVLGFLDFLLPSEFSKVKVAKPLLKLVADATELAKIAAESGASISLDRDLNAILVRSANSENVGKAVALLDKRMKECEELVYVERFDHSDSWLFPIIIGKGGATVQNLQKDYGCSINVSKEELTVAISGDNAESVDKTKEAFHQIIEKARKECVFIDLPESAMAAFIGKGGSNIRQLATDHGVDIERMRKEPTRIQIKGDELPVEGAREAVSLWLLEWEQQHEGISFKIEESTIPSILGPKGSVITAIQNDHDIKVDIDRRLLTVSVRGGQKDDREKAVKKIQKIANEHIARVAEQEELRLKEAAEAAAARIAEARARKENGQHIQKQLPEKQDDKKDRTKEFAAIPVGLTVVENKSSKAKKTKIKKKPAANVETLTGASNAGQSLFNMLVADNTPTATGQVVSPFESSPPTLVDEQWDSSTVSSAANSSGSENEIENMETPVTQDKISYYKSASGFSVRL